MSIGDLIDVQGQRILSEREKAEFLANQFDGQTVADSSPLDRDKTYAPIVQFGQQYRADGSILPGAPELHIKFTKPSEIGGIFT